MDNNELKWHGRFLALASLVSTWSKDPSSKCGAVIVRPNRTIASLGYNGFPRGTDDDCETYDQRHIKYLRVVHAEANAIVACAERPEGYTIYVWSIGWDPSCGPCAGLIINSGIKRIVYPISQAADRALTSIAEAVSMYNQAGVEILPILLEV